ncbi:MAG TPA: hypothetical protein VKG85_12560 [Actinomycetes bacterium]|nr:hypothetical protein [Actinomycetes bacterium]
MRRAVALVATFAITAGLALAGCQGGIGDRLDRSGQPGRSGTDPSSGADASGSADPGAGGAGESGMASLDADLDEVDAMLRDIDSMLAQDRQPPADAD